jgi:hypothetical protein
MGLAGRPAAVISCINSCINKAVNLALQDKNTVAQFEANGVVPRIAAAQDSGVWIKTSVVKLAYADEPGDITINRPQLWRDHSSP